MIAIGFLASLGLTGFYYLVLLLLTKDAGYPLRQFLALQPWMSLLVFGFGVQWALFTKLRRGKVMAGGNSLVSGSSMVACCAHHGVEALPFLGLAGAAAFLVNYQKVEISAADDSGNNYQAVNWSGGSGGHHLEGELTLAALKPGAKQLKLILTDIDQKGGELTWEL